MAPTDILDPADGLAALSDLFGGDRGASFGRSLLVSVLILTKSAPVVVFFSWPPEEREISGRPCLHSSAKLHTYEKEKRGHCRDVVLRGYVIIDININLEESYVWQLKSHCFDCGRNFLARDTPWRCKVSDHE